MGCSSRHVGADGGQVRRSAHGRLRADRRERDARVERAQCARRGGLRRGPHRGFGRIRRGAHSRVRGGGRPRGCLRRWRRGASRAVGVYRRRRQTERQAAGEGRPRVSGQPEARTSEVAFSMAPPKLDGAGIQKMKTIEEAQTQLQRLHGIVETYALTLKQNKPTSMYAQQVKRTLPPLVGLLKPQFGMIADQVAALNLVATRGGTEVTKIRMLPEAAPSPRPSLNIAILPTKAHHIPLTEPKPSPPSRSGRK